MAQEDNSELILSRKEADRATYTKLFEIAQSVFNDENARLPFIPLFYRRKRTLEDEFNYLEETFPKVLQARGEEFCLEACSQSGKDCLTQCQEFTSKAFEIGNILYSSLHKPYEFSKFKVNQDQQ